MNEEKKWQRYTRVSDIWINMTRYQERLRPMASGCVEYHGARHRQGYAMIGVLNLEGVRKMTVAHRVAMRLKLNRALSSTEDVRHTCGNNLCCNPEHLYIRNEEPADAEPVNQKIPAFAR